MWSSRKRAGFSVVLSLWAGVASAWAAFGVGQAFPELTKHGLEGAVSATIGQVVLVDF